MSLDSFLNFAIPFGIFAYFGFRIYMGVQGPADKFFLWVRELFEGEDVELNENRFDIGYD